MLKPSPSAPRPVVTRSRFTAVQMPSSGLIEYPYCRELFSAHPARTPLRDRFATPVDAGRRRSSTSTPASQLCARRTRRHGTSTPAKYPGCAPGTPASATNPPPRRGSCRCRTTRRAAATASSGCTRNRRSSLSAAVEGEVGLLARCPPHRRSAVLVIAEDVGRPGHGPDAHVVAVDVDERRPLTRQQGPPRRVLAAACADCPPAASACRRRAVAGPPMAAGCRRPVPRACWRVGPSQAGAPRTRRSRPRSGW